MELERLREARGDITDTSKGRHRLRTIETKMGDGATRVKIGVDEYKGCSGRSLQGMRI